MGRAWHEAELGRHMGMDLGIAWAWGEDGLRECVVITWAWGMEGHKEGMAITWAWGRAGHGLGMGRGWT